MKARVREIKRSAAPLVAFAVGGEPHYLRCAYPDDTLEMEGDARFFANIRAQHSDSFFDQFAPLENDVLSWVRQNYSVDDTQASFIVAAQDGERRAFFGFTGIDIDKREAEFGRVLRAESGPRGLMGAAMAALFYWARHVLVLRQVRLEVFRDNARAISLYKRAGFVATGSHVRVRQEHNGHVRWEPGSGADSRDVVEMELELT